MNRTPPLKGVEFPLALILLTIRMGGEKPKMPLPPVVLLGDGGCQGPDAASHPAGAVGWSWGTIADEDELAAHEQTV